MFTKSIIRAAITILLGISLPITPCWSQPAFYVDKIFSTPDLTQTDSRGHFAEGGKNYCAPVAVSDSFVWLSAHGFPRLLPDKQGVKELSEKQLALVQILSSPEYMNTSADEGTEVFCVLRGIKKYIQERGYSIKRLTYQGFRQIDPEFDSGHSCPRLSMIKQDILGKSGVWLNLGWYKYKPENDTYTRLGGHWVTLVGYGVNVENKLAPNTLIVHNPSRLAGLDFHNDFLALLRIKSGLLISHKLIYGFPLPAAGFYKITSGLPAIRGCDAIILEGSIVLELQ